MALSLILCNSFYVKASSDNIDVFSEIKNKQYEIRENEIDKNLSNNQVTILSSGDNNIIAEKIKEKELLMKRNSINNIPVKNIASSNLSKTPVNNLSSNTKTTNPQTNNVSENSNRVLSVNPSNVSNNTVSSTNNEQLVTFVCTAYASTIADCGKTDGITASGTPAHIGTVAAPKDIKFGTKVKIPGIESFTGINIFNVEDRGGAITRINSNTIKLDIWFPTEREAINFGRRIYKGYILK